MARTSAAGQLAFNFASPPPAPIDQTPTWFKTKLDKNYSYGELGISRNDDGTWAISTRDQFQGYCGHGGPFWGNYESFDEALEVGIAKLWKGWRSISERVNDSCCTEKHRAMARKGMKWLDELAAEYGVAH